MLGQSISIRGRSHIVSGTPCQDYSAHVVSDGYAIAVVSDGHGSAPHFRSDVGSKLAVESSVEVIGKYLADMDSFKNSLEEDESGTMDRVVKSIISEWTFNVQEYDGTHPLTDDENKLISENGIDPTNMFKRYGATLIIGVIASGFSFGIQIGDGDLLCINRDSEFNSPIPEDENCVFNHTTSICSSNAFDSFRHFVIMSDEIVAMLASTDGFTTSFVSDESYGKQCLNYLYLLDQGDNWDKITENLQKRSEANAEDDVSLSIVFKPGQISYPVVLDHSSEPIVAKYFGFKSRKAAYRKKKSKQSKHKKKR